ncbi:MAG: glycosyltransferase [Planctomycetota bacterium]
MNESFRVLGVSTILPSVEDPGAGVFILRRLASLPPEFEVEALRTRPWFPGIARVKPHLARARVEREERQGVVIRDLRFAYLPGFLKRLDGVSLARRLRGYILASGHRYDLLDGHFAYPAGFAAVRTGRVFDIPSVVTLRGTMASYLGDGRRGAILETLRGATRLVAVSSSLARLAREVAGEDLDVRVIGNGVDTELFRSGDREAARRELGLGDRGPVLLTVGGLVPRKGVHRVLEALPDLVRKHPDLVYLVVGGAGVEGDFGGVLRERVAALGLEDHVRFTGPVPPEDLPTCYRAADLFVLSTSNEGWANVLQESLACGLPVVATDVGGNREVVGGETHGLVIPFGDPRALATALDDALAARWDRDAVAAWGGRRDWKDVGREVAAVFREAMDA